MKKKRVSCSINIAAFRKENGFGKMKKIKITWFIESILVIFSIAWRILYKELSIIDISIGNMIYKISVILIFLMGIYLIWKDSNNYESRKTFLQIFGALSVAFAALSFYLYQYLYANFWGITFSEIYFHLRANLSGSNMSVFIMPIVKGGILIAVTVALYFLAVYISKKFHRKVQVMLVILMLSLLIQVRYLALSAELVSLGNYIKNQKVYSSFIEDNYVDGKTVKITFPDKKRNLIFIYLESMETTFMDQDSGGDVPENIIPELTEIAMSNISFGNGDKVEGAVSPEGTRYTVGAIVAATAGVPLHEGIITNKTLTTYWNTNVSSNYLPNAYTLGDILKENGYNQEFMIGSDADFSGRRQWFRDHGDYKIFDLLYAREKGFVPEDYGVWWGFEDEKLFAFAKKDIISLAENAEPFNFTLLTVDTHFPGGVSL